MTGVPQLLFLTVVSMFFVHELDAIRQREWRFFFAPISVSDEIASRIFIALHAPLFVVILWYVSSPALQVGIDSFAVIHGGLHLGLRNHPLLEFDSWFSRVWIFGGSVFGALHLVLVM